MKKIATLLFLLLVAWVNEVSAKFVQEVELKDGTVLSGFVYRQRPGKFIVFYANRSVKDSKNQYKQNDKNYTLQWNDVKYIRRSPESDAPWCFDRLTLNDGTTLVGQVESQEIGVAMTVKLSGSSKKQTVKIKDLKKLEKDVKAGEKDLWLDRQYTNRLTLTDNTAREGLIVLQYWGATTDDSYVELLHASGTKERIYVPDIIEYTIYLY